MTPALPRSNAIFFLPGEGGHFFHNITVTYELGVSDHEIQDFLPENDPSEYRAGGEGTKSL